MKFRFDSDLDFQLNAINSVIKLFQGQKKNSFFEDVVVPNIIDLSDSDILENLIEIQSKGNIQVSNELKGYDFSVEMETGTGKTYVYLRTIMELNKHYGFKKFIIIVPSIAIREGVLKTLEITKDHFQQIYNIPYKYFEYDSAKLNLISQFAHDNHVKIMIMTLDSFNKDSNIMNQSRENLFGQKPIDLISKTRPILILDEPQNMESAISKEAISKLNSMFNLRYSATHKEYYNLVYRLTPVDALNNGLVKKIELSSVVMDDDFNHAFIRCRDIYATKNGSIRAKLDVNKKYKDFYKIAQITVKNGDYLDTKTQSPEYEGVMVTEINTKYNFISFNKDIPKLKLGEESGGDKKELIRTQIRETIDEHFRKQVDLMPYGIKVLSLFFIDKVDNYKSKDGFIRTVFENEFNILKLNYPEFKDLNVQDVQGSYFSPRKSDDGIKKDKEAYDKIMKNKENLLSFDEPVQFIFSHSALNEGWDNPNVFNICTLNYTISKIRKRQEIGRGLRLPVNQQGDRITNENFTLTVFSNERHPEYVSKLQKEYIDEFGNNVEMPPIFNHKNRKKLKLKKGYELNPEFNELWKKISQKTKYNVDIDTKNLISACVDEINKIKLDSIKIKIEKVAIDFDSEEGIKTHFIGEGVQTIDRSYKISNILEEISEETNLTKKTILEIIKRLNNFELIFKNPKAFTSSVSLKIKETLKYFLVKGIKYLELDDYWKMKLFTDIDTFENLIVPVEKSIYEGVIYDSLGEKSFAEKLDECPLIKLFIKLPSSFKVQTPIGSYNPDWAIVREVRDQHNVLRDKLYLVRETKFADLNNLRKNEEMKIEFARKHFEAIKTDFDVATSIKDIVNQCE